ncbi:hypothetical protein EJ06DRAFT_584775 [Trichodelitschia bisporula]|uniref:Uncharacterized protein n=1 Tax=Trichodelitschia bisporula TaxID=703511 RepID=A0A6G1HLN2_9PEZI|nr:hypothetical protein EJ06DRAFT_584775 [Trichodelitschia bisporula]
MSESQAVQHKQLENAPILIPALKVGLGAGLTGTFIGSILGTLRSPTPVLFALISGAQWSLLGTTYWALRISLLRTQVGTDGTLTPQRQHATSGAAGGIAAAVIGFATRGRANVLPGLLMGSLTGYGGDAAYMSFIARRAAAVDQPPGPPWWKRVANSGWSPVKVLGDAEYESLLREKMLRVEAEIAVIDDDIRALREGKFELIVTASSRAQCDRDVHSSSNGP